MQEISNPKNLLDLPTDAIVLILKQVPWRNLVSSVSRVCHRLRDAINNNEMQVIIQYYVQHYLDDFICSNSLVVSATASQVCKEWYSKLRGMQSIGAKGIPLDLVDVAERVLRISRRVSFNAEYFLREVAKQAIYVMRHPRKRGQKNPMQLQTTDAVFTMHLNENQRIEQARLESWNTDLLIMLVSSPLDDTDEKRLALKKYAISAGPSQEPCTLAEWTFDADLLHRFAIISELDRVVFSVHDQVTTVFKVLPNGTVGESPSFEMYLCGNSAIWYHKASSPDDCGSFLNVVFLRSSFADNEGIIGEQWHFGIRTFNLVDNCWSEGFVFQKWSSSYEDFEDCFRTMPKRNYRDIASHCGPRLYMRFNVSNWDCLVLEANVDPMGLVSVSEHLISITIDPIGIIPKPKQSGASGDQEQSFNFRIGRKLMMIWEQRQSTHKLFVATLPKLNEQKRKGTVDLVFRCDVSGVDMDVVRQGFLDGLDLSKSLQPLCANRLKICYLDFDSVPNLKRKAVDQVNPAISQEVAKRESQDEPRS